LLKKVRQIFFKGGGHGSKYRGHSAGSCGGGEKLDSTLNPIRTGRDFKPRSRVVEQRMENC
jgi:hypothetical protein